MCLLAMPLAQTGCGHAEPEAKGLDPGNLHHAAMWANAQLVAMRRAHSGVNSLAEAAVKAELTKALAEFVGNEVTWDATIEAVTRNEVYVFSRRESVSGFPVSVHFSRGAATDERPETITFLIGADVSERQALALRQHAPIRLRGVVTSAELLGPGDRKPDYAIQFTVTGCSISALRKADRRA